MHQLNSLKLRNFLLYEAQDFEFKTGVTRIGGQNRTGKSLLFSGVPSVLYGKAAGSLPVNSSIELGWSFLRKKSTDYVTKIKNNKHSVYRNDVDLEPHTIKDARNLIEKAWKIPKDLFYSTVFLSGLRQHPLATGTPQSRSDWLASVLDITSVYDDYQIKAQENLAICKNAKIKFDLIMQQVGQLEAPTCKYSEKQYLAAKQSLKENKKQFNDISDIDSNYAANLSELVVFLETNSDFVSESYDFEAAMIKLDKLAKANVKYEVMQENHEENAELLSKIKSAKDFIKQHSGLKKPVDEYINEYEDRLNELKTRERSLAVKTKIDKIKDRLDDLQEQQSKLTVTSGTCEVCGSIVDAKHAKKHKIELKAKTDKLIGQLSELEDELSQVFTIETTSIKTLEQRLAECHKLKRAQTFIKNAPTNLTNEYDGEKHTKSIRAHKALKKQMEIYSIYYALIKSLPDKFLGLPLTKVKKYHETLKEEIALQKQNREDLLANLDKNTNIIQTYETFKILEANYTSQNNSIKEDLNKTVEQMKDLDAWDALVKSFGNNGIRVLQLQEAANLFGTKLSELSSLLFDDSYKFDIIVKPRKLDVSITRKQMTGGLDTLSGSESRIWSLISALALLHVLPSHLRCDTCFLDEIEANLDQKTRDRYTQDFIPELQQVIDKVVIITPLISGEMKLQPDYDYLVESKQIKNNHVSKLRLL